MIALRVFNLSFILLGSLARVCAQQRALDSDSFYLRGLANTVVSRELGQGRPGHDVRMAMCHTCFYRGCWHLDPPPTQPCSQCDHDACKPLIPKITRHYCNRCHSRECLGSKQEDCHLCSKIKDCKKKASCVQCEKHNCYSGTSPGRWCDAHTCQDACDPELVSSSSGTDESSPPENPAADTPFVKSFEPATVSSSESASGNDESSSDEDIDLLSLGNSEPGTDESSSEVPPEDPALDSPLVKSIQPPPKEHDRYCDEKFEGDSRCPHCVRCDNDGCLGDEPLDGGNCEDCDGCDVYMGDSFSLSESDESSSESSSSGTDESSAPENQAADSPLVESIEPASVPSSESASGTDKSSSEVPPEDPALDSPLVKSIQPPPKEHDRYCDEKFEGDSRCPHCVRCNNDGCLGDEPLDDGNCEDCDGCNVYMGNSFSLAKSDESSSESSSSGTDESSPPENPAADSPLFKPIEPATVSSSESASGTDESPSSEHDRFCDENFPGHEMCVHCVRCDNDGCFGAEPLGHAKCKKCQGLNACDMYLGD